MKMDLMLRIEKGIAPRWSGGVDKAGRVGGYCLVSDLGRQ